MVFAEWTGSELCLLMSALTWLLDCPLTEPRNLRPASRPTRCGKGSKLMLLVDSRGRPQAVLLAAANRAENQLVESLLEASPTAWPDVLLYDKACDDDAQRDRLAAVGIFLIAPHRLHRPRPARHDGRHRRRYRRRFLVERTNAWLHNFRRLPLRYDYYPFMYLGFVTLACLISDYCGARVKLVLGD